VIGHSHAIVGACAGVAVAHALGGDSLAAAVLGAVAGLVPDVDSHASTLGHYIPGWAPRPRHRGPTHSLVFCAGLAAATYGAQAWLLGGPPASLLLTLVVLAGSLSHLAADGMTDEGIPLLWPLTSQRLGLPWPLCFPTGSRREHLVVLAIMGVTIWSVYDLHRLWVVVHGRLE
jgi:inner membrane protein